MCTCPLKHSLNPYTGCTHGCLYCYATSYIPRFFECRPKVDLLARLRREVRRLGPGALIAMSNSSDPYPPVEKRLGLTRGCLEVLKSRDLRVQVVTKSDIVVRDIDLLSGMRATVALTVTTLDDDIARRLEPGAPSPGSRLWAIRALRDAGVPVSARVDPIIPGLNEGEIEDLVTAVADAGALHVTSSTYKARSDSLGRVTRVFPELEGLRPLYHDSGRRIGGSMYLPADIRAGVLSRVRDACRGMGLTSSTCREGLISDAGVSCDGSHLAQLGE